MIAALVILMIAAALFALFEALYQLKKRHKNLKVGKETETDPLQRLILQIMISVLFLGLLAFLTFGIKK